LRAVAILSVVACHVGLGWARGGLIGVDVFFVISGYLIGTLVYKEIRGHSFTLGKFYARRAKRILPALFGVLVFCYAGAFLLLLPSEMKPFSASAISAVVSGSNFYFWHSTNYFSPDSRLEPLLMTWSLAVEEQFYLLFPLFMLLTRKWRWQTQFLCIGGLAVFSLATSIWGTFQHPIATFYSLPTRGWELAAGVLLAIGEANSSNTRKEIPPFAAHSSGVLGLGLFALAFLLVNRGIPFPGYTAMLPVAGAVLIVAGRHGIVNRLLSWRPVVLIGLISYSWYLWHWPLLSFVRIVGGLGISQTMTISIGIVSLLCAVLSYKFIERPFRASTTATPTLLRSYAAVLPLVMLPAAAFYITKGLPQRIHDIAAVDAAGAMPAEDPCLVGVDHGNLHPRLDEPCAPAGNGRAIAIIGDSHAAVLAGTFRLLSERSGYQFVEFIAPGCPPLDRVSPVYSSDPHFWQGCAQFYRSGLNQIDHDTRIQAVILAGYWARPFPQETLGGRGYEVDGQFQGPFDPARSWELLQLGLDHLVSSLEHAGKIVYMTQDNPNFSFDPTSLTLAQLLWARRTVARLLMSPELNYARDIAPEFDPADAEKAYMIVSRIAAMHPGVRIIDLRSSLCTPIGCRFAEGDRPLYIHSDHLSPLGAQIALAGLSFPRTSQ
jgi:peptidoglycan/LPS O-acetylase OafA/YrhL